MKSAALYRRLNKSYFHSQSKTTAGLWIFIEPVIVVEGDDAGRIGRAIQACLAESREGIPHPKSFTGLGNPLLKLAGVRSFNAFAKYVTLVEIGMDDETVTLIPTRNGGPKEGFIHLNEKALLSEADEEALGTAAIAALALCE